jgi:hypothetical protein
VVEPITFQTVFQFLQTASIMVGITYYVLTLRNQRRNQEETLETRQAQFYMQIYNQGVNDRNFIEAFLRIQSLEWSNSQEFLETINYENPETRENAIALTTLVGYYEGVGTLVKENMLSIRWIALLFGSWTRIFCEKIKPVAEDARVHNKAPRTFSETEYLYNELMRYMEDHPELKT